MIGEVADFGNQSIEDILSWGQMKLGADNMNGNKKKYTSFAEEILLGMEEEEEQHDQDEAREEREQDLNTDE